LLRGLWFSAHAEGFLSPKAGASERGLIAAVTAAHAPAS